MGPGPDFEAEEAALRDAEFIDCRLLWYSSNQVFIAQMCLGDERFAAIYKPANGESPLWDFPAGTLFRREAAAYELARLLAWPIVPATVARDGPYGPGSLQRFVRHDPAQHFFVLRDMPEMVAQLQRLCLFDAIANNADRKGGHCLLDEDGHIWGIDHGLCFHAQDKLRSVIWDWAGEPAPQSLLEDVAAATGKIAADDPAMAALRELLSPDEVAALASRMDRILERGRFPMPGAARHYPWPLV